MKFTKEVQNYELIITNNAGKSVKIIQTSYLNIGKGVSLYGNKNTEFREYMQMLFEGNEYFNTWPKVNKIEYIEQEDVLLFKDLIEIYDEYLECDEPFIMDIYFYVDFNGNILTDAYAPIIDRYFSLNIDSEISRCPWLDDNLSVKEKFYRRYKEIKEDIGWQIIFEIEKRKEKMSKKLLNKKGDKKDNKGSLVLS